MIPDNRAATEAAHSARRAADAAGVVVRALDELGELEAAIVLWDDIWERGTGLTTIRLDLLRAITAGGGYAAGAYDRASGRLLGAALGFFGPPARAELHSHVTGVVPEALGRSVGFALKLHQRAWALGHGARVIAWTYDPLIRRNAYFNLGKLGARAAAYRPDFYGVMADAINRGTATDRMLVHWELGSSVAADASAGRPRVASFAAERARGAVVALSAGADGGPVPGAASAGGQRDAAGTFLVAVPPDIEALRLADAGLAASWRTALRAVLMPLLDAGARVTGFDRDGWYVLAGEGERG
jgi:predicted GNAT superfamily acetyltransferase